MAGRPKQGIDYSGWSVDIFDSDPKIDKLLDAKGWRGFGIYFFLCQRAYKTNGYFYKWSYDDCATTARKMGGGINSGTVEETVRFCFQVDLFDQRLFDRSANKLRDSVNGAGKAAQTSGKGMKLLGRISRMMMMRFVMQAVMAATGAIKEGFQNLARYSGSANQTLSSLMSSLLYLKNSLAAGFAPILSVAVPAINALIDAIASALAWIGQLAAALTGKSTFVKAKKTQEDYAKSLKKTGSAAKNAGKSLADFDKLRLLDKQNSGGGGGGSGTDPSQMFETVAVSSSLVKALDALKSKWNDLSSLFAKGFKVGLGDVAPRFETIKKGLQYDLWQRWRSITHRRHGRTFQALKALSMNTG